MGLIIFDDGNKNLETDFPEKARWKIKVHRALGKLIWIGFITIILLGIIHQCS